MTKPNSSEIIVLLDRSGSMRTVKDDMAGGFETLVEEQRKVPGDCLMSLFQFDDVFEYVYVARPLSNIPHLTLQPRGNTALWDAVGKAVVLTGQRFANMPEEQRPSKVIVVVITDGQENASKEWRQESVRSLIQEQEERYGWQFVYLGSSLTTVYDANKIGIKAASLYTSNAAGVRNMNSVVGRGIASYRSGNDNQIASYIPSSVGES